MSVDCDVICIGAGPSGAIASALLVQAGYSVIVLERQQFPRFSIGESLLPQCMAFVEEAGMLEAVQAGNFQFKNGAAFERGTEHTFFNFEEKFTPGPGTTFQVQRAAFDKILADEAQRFGADIRYGHEILEADFSEVVNGEVQPRLTAKNPDGTQREYRCRFVLDASGFGRVLPRLLKLESPSGFPVRQSIFTHVTDHIPEGSFDRNKILVTVHPEHRDVWYWLIPFSNGRCSLGCVAETEFFAQRDGDNPAKLKQLVQEAPGLKARLANAEFDTPVQQIVGYSANVSSLHGPGFALLGNAGEFLDPVFSSGVTIAMKSASSAVALLKKQFRGEAVDWENDYAIPLKRGVDTFRDYVEAWYDGKFQDIIFHHDKSTNIKHMISSVLAGYAWDESNPWVSDSKRRLRVLSEACRVENA
ncbi:MAG: NAD(P)/FAD-dependent oxidoreductase [Spongiibacteraceae bacterium]